MKKRGLEYHGYRNTSTYSVWTDMKTRCLNPNSNRYNSHGGRGIVVCERWLIFTNFLADMGEKPEGLTLDRIDNNKGYYPENCRWATNKEQSNNRRSNKWLEFNGKKMTLQQWADHLELSHSVIIWRLKCGWPMEKVLGPRLKKRFLKTKQHS